MSIIDLIHLCMRFGTDCGIKAMTSGISGGKLVKTFASMEIAFEFVYSIKTGRRFNSHAKCSVRVSTSSTSLLFAVSTPTAKCLNPGIISKVG